MYAHGVVDGGMPVWKATVFFKDYQGNFVTLVSGGLLGREKMTLLLSSQFGWALNADKQVTSVMDAEPLVINGHCGVVDLSCEFIRRPEEKFFDDVIVATDGEFSGLLSVVNPVIARFRNLERKVVEIEEQRAMLARSLEASLLDREGSQEELERKIQAVMDAARETEHSSRKIGCDVRENRQKVVTMEGLLENFSALELAQMLVQGAKTGRLVLNGGPEMGEHHVFFSSGQIIHAAGPQGQGEDALYAALSLEIGSFVFHFNDAPARQTVDIPPTALLMEACRRQDEGMIAA